LTYAIKYAEYDTAQMMVCEFNADVNYQTGNHSTALHCAAKKRDGRNMVQFLLDHGADRTLKNDQVQSSLFF